MRGVKAWLLGDWRQAYEISEQAISLFEKNSILGWERTTSQIIALSGLVMLGDWRLVSRKLGPLVEDAQARGDRYASVGLRLMPYPHIVRLAQGRPDEAETVIRAALGEWQQDAFHIQHCDAAFGLMDIAMYRADAGQALAVMRKYWTPLTRSHLLNAELTRIFFYTLRARARLMELNDVDRKLVFRRRRLLSRIARDVRKVSREPAPWCKGWVSLLQAGIDFERGWTDSGVVRLRDAAGELDRAHMPQYAAATLHWLDKVSGIAEVNEETRQRSKTWLAEQRVHDPDRLFATLAP